MVRAHFRICTSHTTRWVFVLAILVVGVSADAQRRFAAKGIAGFTASQIDGDQSAGYHKVGLQAGLGVEARLKEKQSASLELLFSQRGARNQPQIPPAFSVTLDYIEIPVQWHYADWLMEGEGRSPDWYRVRFNAGLSYSYLLDIRDKYENTSFPAAFPFFTRNTVALVLGATFYATEHVGFTFRYNRPLHFLYRPGEGRPLRNSLYEHFLAFQVNYKL